MAHILPVEHHRGVLPLTLALVTFAPLMFAPLMFAPLILALVLFALVIWSAKLVMAVGEAH